MSWSDPCSNCGQSRADCDCGDWCGYDKNSKINNHAKNIISRNSDAECFRKWSSLP